MPEFKCVDCGKIFNLAKSLHNHQYRNCRRLFCPVMGCNEGGWIYEKKSTTPTSTECMKLGKLYLLLGMQVATLPCVLKNRKMNPQQRSKRVQNL